MKPKLLRASLLAAPLIVLSPSVSHADNDGIWTDTSAAGTWQDSLKWSGSLPAYGANFTAYFTSNIAADTTVTQDVASLLIGNLLFSDNGAAGSKWTLAGQPFALGDGVSPALSTITTLTPTTISAQITGANAISKLGASTLTLTGANTYSGGNNLQEGTLIVGSATALGSGPVSVTGNPTILANATFANSISIDGPNLNIQGGFNQFSGVISGTGTLTTTSTATVSGMNTFTGKVVVTNGWLCITKDRALGAVPLSATADAITVTSTGALSSNGAGAAFTLDQNRGIVIASGNTKDWDFTKDVTIQGVISGAGALRKGTSNGTLTLTSANTYSGGTFVSAGILSMGSGGTGADTSNPGAFGSGTVTVNAGGTIRLWIQNNGSYSVPNNWAINGGALEIGDGTYTLPGTISLGATGGTLRGSWGGKPLTSTGVISGNGPLKWVRASTNSRFDAVMTGANTYTGATSIDGIKLTVSSLNSVSGGTAASNLGAPTTVPNGTISMGTNATAFSVGTHSSALVYNGTGETTDRVIDLHGDVGAVTLDQSGTGLLKFSSSFTNTTTSSKTVTIAGSTAGSGELGGALVDNATVGTTALSTTFAAGATTVELQSVDGISVGASISGTGITGGQTITAINTATRVVTLSAGANAASGAYGSSYTVTGVKNIAGLSKTGTGTWTLSGANTYTGITTVSAGVLKFAKQSSLYNNTPASWTAAKLTVNSGATAAFNVGGAGEFTAADIATLQGLTNVVSGTSATSGFRSGSLLGMDTTNAPGGVFTLATAITNHIAGTTTDILGVSKLGSGKLLLTGANAYTGTTTVTAGILGGSGSSGSPLTVAAAGTLAPGAGIGTWAAKSATFASGSTLAAEINSIAVAADKLTSTGAVALGGATLSLTDLGSTALAVGTKLTLVDYTGGSLTGTFAGLAEGAAVTVGGNGFTIRYADSSKVTLTATGSAGYTGWAATHAGGQAANLDFDGDGIPNGVEYLMGVSGSGFTANPQPVGNVITWPKDPSAVASYVVEVSADLSSWTTAPNGSVTDNGTSVSFALPAGDSKRFARLKVTTP